MNRLYPAFLLLLFIGSCTTSKGPLFGKRTPHEKYSKSLDDAGLKNSQLGIAWHNAATQSIAQPLSVSLPFKETGFFAADKPAAAGYIFSAKRGENIIISLSTVPASGFLLFTELWQPESDGKNKILTIMDTLSRKMEYTTDTDGQFILRIQPELLKSVEYTLTVVTAPSLAFPVDRSGNPKLISFWGMDRDAGSRSHEGVDISAKFRTPVLAAADGSVSRVSVNNLGGKVVFMRDGNTGHNLYYAHLDSQLVQSGQRVKRGDKIGLVGNTGNARGTVPHLHFGIYTNNGPVDPLAFIDNRQSEPKPVRASLLELNKWLRTTASATVYEGPSEKNNIMARPKAGEVVFIIGATDNWYKVLLPGGQTGYMNSNILSAKMLRRQKIESATRLLDNPDINSPAKTIITKGTSLDVIGSHNNFYLVELDSLRGWVAK